MKKFYYLLAGITMMLVTIIACEKASIEIEELQAVQNEELLLSKGDQVTSAKGEKEKVNICHWDAENEMYVSISIAPEAVVKHLANHMTDYGTQVEKDKYPFSTEGYYIIHRDNGAVLNIRIHPDGTITGSGYTSNGPIDPQTYLGTVTVFEDHTILLVVSQSPQGGTHKIKGIVSECDGIIEFTNDYTLIE